MNTKRPAHTTQLIALRRLTPGNVSPVPRRQNSGGMMTVGRVEELLNTAEMMVGLYEDPMEAAILASAVVAAVERRTQTRLPWMRIIDEFHACMRQGVYRLGQ